MFPRKSLLPSQLQFLFDDDNPPAPVTPPPPVPPAPPAPPAQTFSQEDVNRIVQERLARETAKFADYEDLKTKATKLDEIEAASQTETQRLQAAADAAKAEADAAKQEGANALSTAHSLLKNATLTAEATAAGVSVPAAAVALLGTDAAFKEHMGKVTVGDDGQVTGAKEAITALIEAQPNLVGTTPRPGGGDGGPRQTPPPKELDAAIAEASEKGDWGLVGRLNAQKLAQQVKA